MEDEQKLSNKSDGEFILIIKLNLKLTDYHINDSKLFFLTAILKYWAGSSYMGI